MSKFTDLKPGDYIWGVHNIYWDKHHPSEFYFHPSEYQLQKYTVIKNNLNTPHEFDISDRYEESEHVTKYEHYIEVHFHNMVYSRYYSDHYNEYGHLLITPSYNDHGPDVEFFPDYESAKEYLVTKCNNEINACKNTIEKENYKIQLLEKSLEQIK